MLKDDKLSTYIFLKTNFRLEKYLTLLRPEYRNQFVDCAYQHTDFSQKWADIITHQEQKEYVIKVLLELQSGQHPWFDI